jgi:hypothetical protein
MLGDYRRFRNMLGCEQAIDIGDRVAQGLAVELGRYGSWTLNSSSMKNSNSSHPEGINSKLLQWPIECESRGIYLVILH